MREWRRTSNEMWSPPTRISSSCLPTMFFFGQLVSSSLKVFLSFRLEATMLTTYFVMSLDSTIRLSSLTTKGPIHTKRRVFKPTRKVYVSKNMETYSLFESNCRFCSLSCWRSASGRASIRTRETHAHACQSGQCLNRRCQEVWCPKKGSALTSI
jgi:hypothetical protein